MSLRVATRRALLSVGGVTYLLRDELDDTVAAGFVHLTAATPGPGTRTVVDTGSDLSIGSDVLTFAGGSGNNGDPGLWLDGLSRTLGRYEKCALTLTQTNKQFEAGWDNGQTGAIALSVRFDTSAGIRAQIPTAIVIGAYTATSYATAIIQRAVGAYYFIKGGAFTAWTLLWVDSTNTSATLYPAIAGRTSGLSATADYIRIPDRLFIPPVAIYDTFTRANGALGDSETTGPDSQPVTPRTWESGGATWAIASNEAVNTPSEGGELLTNPGFEGVYAAGVAPNWAGPGTVNPSEEGALIHGGSAAQRFDASDSTANSIRHSTDYVADRWYRTSIWARGIAGSEALKYESTPIGLPPGAASWTLTTSYQQFIATHRAASTGTRTPSFFSDNVANDIVIDDASVKALTLNTLFTDVDDGATSDYLAEVELDTVVAGTQAGMVLNLDDATTPANFVIAYHDGTNAKLDKCVAGTYTSVISAAATYAAGATLVVIKEGTSYSLYYNSAKIGSTSTISDAGIISNTKHGLFSTNSGNQLDNFTVFYRTNAAYDTEFDLV